MHYHYKELGCHQIVFCGLQGDESYVYSIPCREFCDPGDQRRIRSHEFQPCSSNNTVSHGIDPRVFATRSTAHRFRSSGQGQRVFQTTGRLNYQPRNRQGSVWALYETSFTDVLRNALNSHEHTSWPTRWTCPQITFKDNLCSIAFLTAGSYIHLFSA